jgi:response regulator RpfG family c-di-GMP phosphodiesterase
MKILSLGKWNKEAEDNLQSQLQKNGFSIIHAASNDEANKMLLTNRDTQMIILDGNFPQKQLTDFVEFLEKDHDFSKIPVIINGASKDNADILENLKSTYHYILPHFLEPHIQTSMIKSVANDINEKKQKTKEFESIFTSMQYIENCTLKIKTLDDVTNVSDFIAKLHPNAEKVFLGISEILINSVEHGNLNIDYETKSQLISTGNWVDEINRRLTLDEHKHKQVIINISNTDTKLSCHIIDQGTGFNWKNFTANNNQNPSTTTHGRGIALASALSIDEIEYIGCGNEVRVYFWKGGLR